MNISQTQGLSPVSMPTKTIKPKLNSFEAAQVNLIMQLISESLQKHSPWMQQLPSIFDKIFNHVNDYNHFYTLDDRSDFLFVFIEQSKLFKEQISAELEISETPQEALMEKAFSQLFPQRLINLLENELIEDTVDFIVKLQKRCDLSEECKSAICDPLLKNTFEKACVASSDASFKNLMYCIKAFAGLPQEKAMVLISAYVRLQQYHKLDNKNATSFLECLKELSSLFTSKNFADLAKLESTDKYIQQKNAILSNQPELAVCYDEVEPDDEPDLQDLEIELFIKLQMELEAIGLDLMNLPGSEELFKLNALKKVYDAIAKNLNIPTMVIDLPDMDTNIELADAIYAAEREECMEDDMKLAMKLYADEKHYSGGVVNIQDPNHAYERDLQVKREFDSYNEAPNHEYDPELSRAIDLSLNEGGKINSQQQPQRAATANAPALSLSQHMWNSHNYYMYN